MFFYSFQHLIIIFDNKFIHSELLLASIRILELQELKGMLNVPKIYKDIAFYLNV